jgi:RNA polymerase sigma factor (sigma-70 family)
VSTSNLSHFLRHLRVLSEAQAARDLTDGELLERFRVGREETAFAILLQRHGPMVLGVCRRLLADTHAAEDAFQATFLVLVRKAASIRKQDSVASWLHGVARRVALKARLRSARDSALERQVLAMPRPEPSDELTWQELRTVLDEELDQLPEKYRTPLVLCGLEGKTHEQAARELGCPKSSLTSRLVKAREMLQERLARRGIVLSAATLAAVLTGKASAAMPALLTITTVRAALAVAATRLTTAAGVSANVVALVEEGIKGMGATKVKAGMALLLMTSMLVAGTGVVAHQTQESRQPPEKQAVEKPAAQGRDKAQPEEKPQVAVDRYGDPLPDGALARLGTLRMRHSTFITGAAFTRDSKTVIVSDQVGNSIYWDVATGKEVHRFQTRGNNVITMALSSDGKTLAIASGRAIFGGGRLKLSFWDVATDTAVVEWPVENEVYITQFAPDGKTVALSYQQSNVTPADNLSLQRGKTIDLRDVATGKSLHILEGHTGKVTCLAYAPDGKKLASGSQNDPNVRIWDTATGKQIRTLVANNANMLSLAFAPDGKTLATCGKDAPIQFWDLATEKCLREAEQPHGSSVSELCYFPDSKAIAGIGGEKLRVFDVATGKQLREGKGTPQSMQRLTVSPDGKIIATSGGDARTFDLWDAATGKLLHDYEGLRQRVLALSFSSDGHNLFAVDDIRGHAIAEWDTVSSKLLRKIGESPNEANGLNGAKDLTLSPDGRFLAAGGYEDHTIRLWELATGKEVRRFKGHTQNVLWVCYSADGKAMASSSDDNTLRLWDVATGKEQCVISLNRARRNAAEFALSPDSKIVAVEGLKESLVKLWDTATGNVIRELATPFKTVMMVTFSPDGKMLATKAMNEGHVCLWDVASGSLLRQLDTATKNGFRVVFSPDGRTLAIGNFFAFSGMDGRDSAVSLWEVATGRERARFLGEWHRAYALAFSPDGMRLASGSDDGTILIWDVTGRARAAQQAQKPLLPKELDGLWTDLMGEDAAKAHRALWGLVAAPREAVPLLKQRLEPVSPPSDKGREQVALLLRELTTGEFAARQKAEAELVKLGTSILPLLRKAAQEEGLPLEARRRLENLIERLVKVGEGDRVRHTRVLELLEHLGTSEAKVLLEAYASGVPGVDLTEEAKASLQRLARRSASAQR